MTMQAILNDIVIAESDDTIVVEGNHYFPTESIRQEYFTLSDLHTTCHWKGVASYYSVEVDGHQSKDAAWFYPEPSPEAAQIRDHVAFWKDVRVVAVEGDDT